MTLLGERVKGHTNAHTLLARASTHNTPPPPQKGNIWWFFYPPYWLTNNSLSDVCEVEIEFFIHVAITAPEKEGGRSFSRLCFASHTHSHTSTRTHYSLCDLPSHKGQYTLGSLWRNSSPRYLLCGIHEHLERGSHSQYMHASYTLLLFVVKGSKDIDSLLRTSIPFEGQYMH